SRHISRLDQFRIVFRQQSIHLHICTKYAALFLFCLNIQLSGGSVFSLCEKIFRSSHTNRSKRRAQYDHRKLSPQLCKKSAQIKFNILPASLHFSPLSFCFSLLQSQEFPAPSYFGSHVCTLSGTVLPMVSMTPKNDVQCMYFPYCIPALRAAGMR